jgi:hypothetical protein
MIFEIGFDTAELIINVSGKAPHILGLISTQSRRKPKCQSSDNKFHPSLKLDLLW